MPYCSSASGGEHPPVRSSWHGSHRPQGSLWTGTWSIASVPKNSMQTHNPGCGVTSGVCREPAVRGALTTCCPEPVVPCTAAHGSVPWGCWPCPCPKELLQTHGETSRSFTESALVSHGSSTVQGAVVSCFWNSALAARSSADPPSATSWPLHCPALVCAAEISHRLHLPTANVNTCYSPERRGLITNVLNTLCSDWVYHGLWPGSSWDGRMVLTPDRLVIRGPMYFRDRAGRARNHDLSA